MVANSPWLLSAEQRDVLVRVPANLSECDLGCFYTLSDRDLDIIQSTPATCQPIGLREHLDELRRELGFQTCGWSQLQLEGLAPFQINWGRGDAWPFEIPSGAHPQRRRETYL